jgi:YVTN family beta-propeller protein
MRTTQGHETVPKGPRFSARLLAYSCGALGRVLGILLLLAVASVSARAQYVGYVANATDGTVTVFAVVTSGPTFASQVAPGNSDIPIATVTVGKNPFAVAVTPSPSLNHAYVTGQGDNSLWVIDVSNISQEVTTPGSVTAQNVNAANALKLSTPGGIAIVSITQGANAGKVFAFVANQGNNTVSVVDTSNNTLFGTVTLGAAGASATAPEITATPDGQVFITNSAGVWAIDATSVAATGGTATSVPVNALFATGAPISIKQPQGISSTQYTDGNQQVHTLVLVADSGQPFVFVLDKLGSTTSTQAAQVGSIGTTGVVALNFAGLGTPASVSAAVIETVSTGVNGVELVAIPLPLACCIVAQDALTVTGSPTSLAVVNPGAATQFIYLTESTGAAPVEFASFDNTLTSNCNPTTVGTGCNKTAVTVGNGPTGIAFSTLDANSPPVAWIIPTVSGGFGPLAPVLPSNSPGQLLAESMVGNGHAISTTLSFGGTAATPNPCTLFGTSTTGPMCNNGASGTNAIGGNTVFPPSGVFTVSITNASTASNGNPTTSSIQQQVSVGANCAVSVAPASIIVGEAVQATLTCTAPINDLLAGTVQWGDGATSASPNPVPVTSNPLTLNFSHTYATLSPVGGWPLSVSVSDLHSDSSFAGNITTPQPIAVTVTAPSCTVVASPNPAQVGRMVTATFTCQGTATDTFAGTVNWGDGTPVPILSAMPGTNGTFTGFLTHIYATPNTYTITPTATDTTVSVAGVFSAPASETVVAAGAVTCSLQVHPILVGIGNPVTATLTCAAQTGDTLNGSVTWGDGIVTTTAVTSNANGSAIINFTHIYASLSSAGFPVSATASDTTPVPAVQATITTALPIPVVVVGPPSCTLTAPTAGQTGVSISASLACTGAAGDSLTGVINWGDGTTTSTLTGTVSTAGALVLNFTHSYAAASAPTDSITGSIQDTITGLTGTVSPTSVAATITFTPTVTPVPPTTPITAGTRVQVPVNFAGGVADAGITFTTITCTVTAASNAQVVIPPTCSVTPSTLTLDGNGNGTVQVSVITNGSSTTTAAIPFGGIRGQQTPLFASLLALPAMGLVLLGAGLIGGGFRKRSLLPASLLFSSCLAMLLGGCGPTVQRTNIACTTCTTPASYTVTVTATSQTPVLTATGVFTVVVQP